jgi:molybdopterin converting factor small subunit
MAVTELPAHGRDSATHVRVNYWAAARAAAGVASDAVEVAGTASLADVLDAALSRHADRPRLADVVKVCSVLVGDRPVTEADRRQVLLRPGDSVELLPPFAGG